MLAISRRVVWIRKYGVTRDIAPRVLRKDPIVVYELAGEHQMPAAARKSKAVGGVQPFLSPIASCRFAVTGAEPTANEVVVQNDVDYAGDGARAPRGRGSAS